MILHRSIMSSPFVKKLALSLLSVFLTLAAVEIGLRVGGRDPWLRFGGRESMLMLSEDGDVQYELRPNASGRVWRTNVEINASGYRGIEGREGKHPGYRVIVLGDSIAFGNGMPVEAVFAAKLHQRLAQNEGNVEILNFGVGGYDTLQEVALLELRGLRYQPDLVVVGYCLNDIAIFSVNLEVSEQIRLRESNPLYHSRLVQFIVERVNRARYGTWWKRKNDLATFRRTYEGQIDHIAPDEAELLALMRSAPDANPSRWYQAPERVGRLRHTFGRLARTAEEENFDVVVAVFPWLVGKPGNYPHEAAHRIVAYEARRAGFDVIDFTDEFLNQGMRKLRRRKGDATHPGEAGHEIIAAGLERYLREKLVTDHATSR